MALAAAARGRAHLRAGLPGYEASLWVAIVAPAATPPAIVARLDREIATALASAKGIHALINQGVDVEATTPEVLGARIRDEIAKWREVIVRAGIEPD